MKEEKALFENSLNFTVPDDSDLCPECKENQRRAIENETRRYFICRECIEKKFPLNTLDNVQYVVTDPKEGKVGGVIRKR